MKESMQGPYPVDPYLTDKQYQETFSHSVRACVDLVVGYEGGIILARRNVEPFRDFWSLPGGRLRYKVPILETVHKVAQDELGIEVSILDSILDQIGFIDYTNDGEYLHSASFVFLARVLSGVPRAKSQASEIAVFNKIPENSHPYQAAFLREKWERIFDFISR